MNWKPILLAAVAFILTLVLFFPYDSVIRYRLEQVAPALHYDDVTASPWAGIRLTGVRYDFTAYFSLTVDEIHIRPSGIFPLKWKISLVRGDGRMEAIAAGSPERLTFDARATHCDVSQWIPAIGHDLKLEVDARSAGAVGLRPFQIFDGATFVVERMTGEIPPTSRLAKAGEQALGMPGWASMWGSTIKEGRAAMESSGGGININTLTIRTDGEFAGSGEIRPLWPLSAARLHLEGRATLSGKSIEIDNTVLIGGMLGAGSTS